MIIDWGEHQQRYITATPFLGTSPTIINGTALVTAKLNFFKPRLKNTTIKKRMRFDG